MSLSMRGKNFGLKSYFNYSLLKAKHNEVIPNLNQNQHFCDSCNFCIFPESIMVCLIIPIPISTYDQR